jgi:hypothetical protein
MSDPRLAYIPDEISNLNRKVSDAEWDNDPRLESLVRELNYYKEKLKNGDLYEPNF